MAVNKPEISERIFTLLVGMGYRVDAFDVDGKTVIDPQEATWFSVNDPDIIVKLDGNKDEISLSANKKENVSKLRNMLLQLAQKNLLNFDYSPFDGKLSPKSQKVFVAKNQEKDMADVMEGFGTMYGGAKTSYQPLDNVKLVVKHKAPVNEESRGARSRNIHSIYIQRGEERFKMAENNLKAARAMARHINMGGEMHDSVGTAIVEMATEQRKLSEFVRYVNKRGLVNETNEEYVSLARENVLSIKSTLDRLCGVKTYANAVESIQDMASTEILEDDLDLESKFTETHLDDRVSSAFEGIKRSLSRQQSYRSTIKNAIKNETFENLRNMLHETDVVDFASPQARLSYQVSQMGAAAQNPVLRNHLLGISNRLSSGKSLEQFDYDTIKSCLLSAKEARVQTTDTMEAIEESYTAFIESFDIL